MNATITAKELQKYLAEGSVSLIDVLLPEDYACRHISGARNACVYEMVFLERVAECVPNRDTAVVVYDDSGTTQTAIIAKEKLERASYRNVRILEGGLKTWQAVGFSVESNNSLASKPTTIHDGIYQVDVEKSIAEWTGRNINNRHYGRIVISDGEVVVANGHPMTGHFILDMNTICNLDIQDEKWRDMLHRHLKSEDFFDVERYPTATFNLTSSTDIVGATAGKPNVEITGSLTIKEITRLIFFPAIIALQPDGNLKTQAVIDLDRTLWNVCYGSGKLFERLGMHLVNDLISIELFIVAREVV